MIKISKEESIAIRGKYPNIHISICNRQSSHKKYFVEENRAVMKFVKKMRDKNVIESGVKNG